MCGGGLEFGFAGGTVISGTAIGNTITVNGFSSAGIRSTEPIGMVACQLNAPKCINYKAEPCYREFRSGSHCYISDRRANHTKQHLCKRLPGH